MPERPASSPVTQPTGLRRTDAARHWGVSPAHFDRLVAEGVAPAPRDSRGVKIWLRQELDDAMFDLPVIGDDRRDNTCDAAFGL
jgi:hypothetical protein